MRTAIALAVGLVLGGGTARADVLYVEAGGKAGAYGVGYEYAITRSLSLGASASFVPLRGQQIATAVPYLHATLYAGRRNSLYGELGAALVYSRIPSPVMSWNGASETGAGGVGGIGWEQTRKRLVLRAGFNLVVGEGGVAPWGGFAIGLRP
jgi:hypothetical protein